MWIIEKLGYRRTDKVTWLEVYDLNWPAPSSSWRSVEYNLQQRQRYQRMLCLFILTVQEKHKESLVQRDVIIIRCLVCCRRRWLCPFNSHNHRCLLIVPLCSFPAKLMGHQGVMLWHGMSPTYAKCCFLQLFLNMCCDWLQRLDFYWVADLRTLPNSARHCVVDQRTFPDSARNCVVDCFTLWYICCDN